MNQRTKLVFRNAIFEKWSFLLKSENAKNSTRISKMFILMHDLIVIILIIQMINSLKMNILESEYAKICILFDFDLKMLCYFSKF